MSEQESWIGRRIADLSPEEQRAVLAAYGEPERDYHGLSTDGEQPLREYQPIQPRGRDWRGLLRKLWAPIAAIGAFLAKFGGLLFKFKFLFSIFVSLAFYIWYGGVWFGVGLIVLLFVHEMGHAIEARHQGLRFSAPLFIPFVGAAIALKELPKDAWREARVGIAGPILGSIAALAVYIAAEAVDSRRLAAVAFIGFFINLFNLIPVVPLDGGRIASAIHPAMWFLGFAALLALVFYRPNPILLLILVVVGLELWQRWQVRRRPQMQAYYRVAPHRRLIMGLLYFGLAAALVFGMHATHVPRSF